jgi:DnaK suppressor protein
VVDVLAKGGHLEPTRLRFFETFFETLAAKFRLFFVGDRSRSERTKRNDRRKTMNKTELDRYKAVLEAKQAELSKGLRNRDEIAIEKTPDALDEVQLAGERELAIRNLDREAILLRSVRGALARIADGSYGVCLHCEEDIKPKRLEAVPWAAYCIRCQEAVDRNDFAPTESIDELLANAA